MISSKSADPLEAYVWIWLPEQAEPVVAGRLAPTPHGLQFNYGQSYLARDDAISLYSPELPLQRGSLPLLPGLHMPGCLRDASPDAWGRRVIMNRLLGVSGQAADTIALTELCYLLASGSDRIGALDFQCSPTEYVPRLSTLVYPAGNTVTFRARPEAAVQDAIRSEWQALDKDCNAVMLPQVRSRRASRKALIRCVMALGHGMAMTCEPCRAAKHFPTR
ncbi:MAG: HipA N-terminal domain-containing protein [Gammaproteobacteria bacterium]|nr:HipA N-terminal domain-containing protein [Gammaproteobacteria bacterium]